MTDFAVLSADAFRTAAKDWQAANFPPSLRGLAPPLSGHDHLKGPPADQALWKTRVAAMGWGAPHWPKVYGGAGLDDEQIAILREEVASVGAFMPITGLGLMMLGPTLLEFGTEAQKLRHLPPIARGEVHWCQGFSEPGAGSDLASLRMRCEDVHDPVGGDHWLLNGQKIWTSYAHLSDWCFCIAPTSIERKQGGISFLLVDMTTPGIEARPIKLINGVSHFCETFFTDVRVPRENLVGAIDGGWRIAKRLLQHERTGLSAQRGAIAAAFDLAEMAREYTASDAAGRLNDGDLRGRLADHMMRDHAYRLTLQRRAAESEAGLVPSTPISSLKNVGAAVGQERYELAVEILGLNGLG